MLQVKLFKSDEGTYIETEINKWLAENKNISIVDIKVAITGGGGASIYSIYTIIYNIPDSK